MLKKYKYDWKLFQKKFGVDQIDICIGTFNRLPYLQKCIWSIIASTSVPHRILVLNDKSNDDTIIWLEEMKQRKLLHYLTNGIQLGTAETLNKIIDASNSRWFVFANDDMYFHRFWDFISANIAMCYDDCGAISLYNYTALKVGTNSQAMSDTVLKVKVTGLGATFMYRDLWKQTGGFFLPTTQKMGFFASDFCKSMVKTNIKRKCLYMPLPPYVTHMDMPACKLNEREYSNKVGYSSFRLKEKK